MPDAQVIQLFHRDKPPAEDSEFWEWGRTFVEEGILNLQSIVDEMATCETEEQLRRCVVELQDEVGRWPSLT